MKWELKNCFLVQINNEGLGSHPALYFPVSFPLKCLTNPAVPPCPNLMFYIFSNSYFLFSSFIKM